jgi:NADPH:quinone reductase-like Zn-dependent oxidoreductase
VAISGCSAVQRAALSAASGGVGTFAVQIAKAFGAEVTGVCRTAKVDAVRALGLGLYVREDAPITLSTTPAPTSPTATAATT